jgi:branched-chain amino acid transport system ATP-binding protein
MLRVESIRVGYGDLTIIDDLSLEVRPREMVALIGANGAGKSTLQRAICGLTPIRVGRVLFEGRDISRLPTHQIVRLGLLMVPSNARVFPKFTVPDNLLMGSLANREGGRSYAERLEQVYNLFPVLRDRRGQRAETLSGGERQMLAMGRAMMAEPKLLMLDEPTAGLAPKLVTQVFEFIVRMRDLGFTWLIVEEKVEHVLRIADRAYIMQNGRIVFEGTSEEATRSGAILRAYTRGVRKASS